MTVFVDVDDTLVIYRGDSIHPYGVINGEEFEPNHQLIEKLKSFDGDIVVWSGGGRGYAIDVALMVLNGIEFRAMSKFEDFNQIRPGDIVVDDQKEYYTGMKEFGVRVYGPFDEWE